MDEDQTPNWKPLEHNLGRKAYSLSEWMWMMRSKTGLEFYKHAFTRRYLVLDQEGNAYDGTGGAWVAVDFQTAYDAATKLEWAQ